MIVLDLAFTFSSFSNKGQDFDSMKCWNKEGYRNLLGSSIFNQGLR